MLNQRIATPHATAERSRLDAANRSLPRAWRVAPRSVEPARRPGTARESGHAPVACTSHKNAALSSTDQQLVRVTHPFHPLFARQLPCVGRRYNRHGERLLLQADDCAVWSVPPQWTDLVSPDPDIVMGNGRALLRVADLMELVDLVDRLSGKSPAQPQSIRKGNYTAGVNSIKPQRGSE